MFPTPLITQYLLSFQSPWETTLRAAPLWFRVPTAIQQSSTCLLPSGWCPLVVSEGLKSCNTIQLYMCHKSSKIINIQHLLLESIIILVQHGHFCFKTCLIYEFIISIFIANTLLFLLKMHNIRAIIFPDRNPHDFWRRKKHGLSYLLETSKQERRVYLSHGRRICNLPCWSERSSPHLSIQSCKRNKKESFLNG